MTWVAAISNSLRIPGVVCPCGNPDLTVIIPGTDSGKRDMFGIVGRFDPPRGWCGIPCARRDGWPWIAKLSPVADCTSTLTEA